MIRVLFVDDEQLILDGLRRMLRGQRHEWTMEFADGGPAALDAMEAEVFDVVVADMKMPGMDGAELLTRVKDSYPQTIRVVLSGHAEEDSVMRVIDPSHQYLSKPCDPAVLKTTIDRAFALRRLLEGGDLQALVSKMSTLPSLPKLYDEVMDELTKEEPSMKRVAAIIESDMGMSTKILKLVNSAFFGLRRSMSNVGDAVAFLGSETIVALVLSAGIFEQFDETRIRGFSLEALWSHSNRSGMFATAIAKMAKLEKDIAGHAFTGALLHETGRLMLASNVPEAYSRVLDRLEQDDGLREEDVEREMLGATHGEVGAYLMGLWGLPDSIVEAMAHYTTPANGPEPGFGVVGVVHVAHVLAQSPDLEATSDDALAIDWPYLDSAGVRDQWPAWKDECAYLLQADD